MSSQIGAEQDKHWQEVMELARKHGFIMQAYGGAAILANWGDKAIALVESEKASRIFGKVVIGLTIVYMTAQIVRVFG